MTLEFKRASNEACRHFFHPSAGVGQHEVFASRFAHDARVAAVQLQVFADGLPQVTEHTGGPCEVQSGEVAVLEHHIPGDRAVACHHVDHAVGQPRRLENLHDDLGAVDLGVARFPHDHIAHEGGDGWQIAGNGGEVEWRDGKDKPLQGAVF